MERKIADNFIETVEQVPDGASIMLGGFGNPGVPRNLIAALLNHGVKNLTIIANTPGRARRNADSSGPTDAGDLIQAGMVRKVICAFTAGRTPQVFNDLYEAGNIDAELVPQGTLSERIRAAGSGIGAFYTRTGVGTGIAEGKEHRMIDGQEYILEYPLHADYAFIRAYKADTYGNLVYRLSQRNFNPMMAQAAKCTFAEAEQILEPGEIEPDHIHTPGIFVNRVILIPPAPQGIWEKVY